MTSSPVSVDSLRRSIALIDQEYGPGLVSLSMHPTDLESFRKAVEEGGFGPTFMRTIEPAGDSFLGVRLLEDPTLKPGACCRKMSDGTTMEMSL